MTIRHIETGYGSKVQRITEILYTLDGEPSCARLFGWMNQADAMTTIETLRQRAR